MDISQLSRSPDAALRTLGADTLPTLYDKELAASKLNTLTTLVSIPFRLPSLSNKGTVIIILKLANALTVFFELLLGARYGSSGLTITELARTTLGGNAKVCHNELSTRAVASVVRRVVTDAVISPPLNEGLARVLLNL